MEKTSTIDMGLYDINKQIISQLSNLTDNQLEIKKKEINSLHDIFHNHFYMLYGKEISYFTLFVMENGDLANDVIDCLNNIGEIKAIDYTEPKDAIEIWVCCDEEVTCLYLFPYDSAIVKVEK